MRGACGLTALHQHLGGGVVELLDQLNLANFRRHHRQVGQQALQIHNQQQGAVQRIAVFQAQGGGAIDQPALAHFVRFGGWRLAIFNAAQHVQRGKVHGRAATHVLNGLSAGVEVRIDHVMPVGEVALGRTNLGGVLALQGQQQLRVACRGLGVGAQLLQGFLHDSRLTATPGLAELLQVHLIGVAQRAKPQQRTGQGDADECSGEAGQQVIEVALGFFRFNAGSQFGAGGNWISILGGALEEFHAASPRQFILERVEAISGCRSDRNRPRRAGSRRIARRSQNAPARPAPAPTEQYARQWPW